MGSSDLVPAMLDGFRRSYQKIIQAMQDHGTNSCPGTTRTQKSQPDVVLFEISNEEPIRRRGSILI